MAPKAFMSHAWEDKDRFVREFAARLRAAGVDVWVDEWELHAGDSLVDRIFEEGIKRADVFIVVLSRLSVDKPWVREELNAGVVKKISKECRLIPIVLDGVEVPESLKSTLWVRVTDPSNYDDKLDQVVRSIYGHSDKPPLGAPPSYVSRPVLVPGLNDVDALVLSVIAEVALKNGHQFIDQNAVEARCEELGLSHDGYFESLLALGHEYLVDVEHRHPSVVVTLQITNYGLGRFFEATRPDLGTVRRRLIAGLVNGTDRERTALAATLGEPPLLVEFLLDELDLEGLLTVGKYLGNKVEVKNVSPLLRRHLD